MSIPEPYEYTDAAGDKLRVTYAGSGRHALVYVGHRNVSVPQHECPRFCRAVYANAGLLVPDLPDFADPAEVEALVRVSSRHFREADNIPAVHRAFALDLLAEGWQKPANPDSGSAS